MLTTMALLLLSTCGTLAAFGGETWRKDEPSPIARVTRRGWISLTCLFLALGLNLVKVEEDAASQAASKEKLESSGRKLTDVRTRLDKAYDLIAKQGEINLLSTLSASRRIQKSAILLSFSDVSIDEEDLLGHLLGVGLSPYREAADVSISASPFTGATGNIGLRWRDGRTVTVPDEASLMRSHAIGSKGIAGDATGRKIVIEVEPGPSFNDAAIGYRDLQEGRPVAQISIRFAKSFRTREDARTFVRENPAFRGAEVRIYEDGRDLELAYEMPERLKKDIVAHLKNRSKDLSVLLMMDGPSQLIMQSKLKWRVEPQPDWGFDLTIALVPVERPDIHVGIRAI